MGHIWRPCYLPGLCCIGKDKAGTLIVEEKESCHHSQRFLDYSDCSFELENFSLKIKRKKQKVFSQFNYSYKFYFWKNFSASEYAYLSWGIQTYKLLFHKALPISCIYEEELMTGWNLSLQLCLSLFYKMFYSGSGFYSCIWTAQVQNTCWWPWCKILFLLSHLDNGKSKDCLLLETETHPRESSVFVGTLFAYLPSIPNGYLLTLS